MTKYIPPEDVRACRLELGLTQKQFASLIDRSERACQNWEAPENSPSHRGLERVLFDLLKSKSKRTQKNTKQ